METVLKADIFFFVTTVAIVLVTTLLITLLWYAIQIAKTHKETAQIIKNTVIQVSHNVLSTQDTLKGFFEKLNVIQLFRSAFGFKRQNAKNKKHEDHGTKE